MIHSWMCWFDFIDYSSGFWGLSRHMNYVFELMLGKLSNNGPISQKIILHCQLSLIKIHFCLSIDNLNTAFTWSCPALGYGVYPFFYWWFLLILLVHRYVKWICSWKVTMIILLAIELSEMKRNVLLNMALVGKIIVHKLDTEWYLTFSEQNKILWRLSLMKVHSHGNEIF